MPNNKEPLLSLPISPRDFNDKILTPALRMLPPSWDSKEARVIIIAIALQESRLNHRWQVVNGGGKGPARGLLQFERGTEKTRGGVTGVFLHPTTSYWLRKVCAARNVMCDPTAIWEALETDDILAAALARMLLATDAYPLPGVHDMRAAWDLYHLRTWRPGKPHAPTWAAFHAQARDVVLGGPAVSENYLPQVPSVPIRSDPITAPMPWWVRLLNILFPKKA